MIGRSSLQATFLWQSAMHLNADHSIISARYRYFGIYAERAFPATVPSVAASRIMPRLLEEVPCLKVAKLIESNH